MNSFCAQEEALCKQKEEHLACMHHLEEEEQEEEVQWQHKEATHQQRELEEAACLCTPPWASACLCLPHPCAHISATPGHHVPHQLLYSEDSTIVGLLRYRRCEQHKGRQ